MSHKIIIKKDRDHNKLERRLKMNGKKTKRINVRVSLKDYRILNRYYLLNKEKYKNFSDYIRHLLELGLDDYY